MTRKEIINDITLYINFNGGVIPFNKSLFELGGDVVYVIGYSEDDSIENVGIYVGEHDFVTLEELSDNELNRLYEHIKNYY